MPRSLANRSKNSLTSLARGSSLLPSREDRARTVGMDVRPLVLRVGGEDPDPALRVGLGVEARGFGPPTPAVKGDSSGSSAFAAVPKTGYPSRIPQLRARRPSLAFFPVTVALLPTRQPFACSGRPPDSALLRGFASLRFLTHNEASTNRAPRLCGPKRAKRRGRLDPGFDADAFLIHRHLPRWRTLPRGAWLAEP